MDAVNRLSLYYGYAHWTRPQEIYVSCPSTCYGERIRPSEKIGNADGSDNISGGCVYQVQITGCFIVICLERRLPNMNLLTLQI